jgi:hypothetical protein
MREAQTYMKVKDRHFINVVHMKNTSGKKLMLEDDAEAYSLLNKATSPPPPRL